MVMVVVVELATTNTCAVASTATTQWAGTLAKGVPIKQYILPKVLRDRIVLNLDY